MESDAKDVKTRRGGSRLHNQKTRKTRRGGRRLSKAKKYQKSLQERRSKEVLERMATLEQKIVLYENNPIGCFDPHQLLFDQYVEYENKTVSK